MSDENLDLVHSIFAAWERGDYHSVDWAHLEIEFASIGDAPITGSWKGSAKMTEAWREWLSTWEEVPHAGRGVPQA